MGQREVSGMSQGCVGLALVVESPCTWLDRDLSRGNEHLEMRGRWLVASTWRWRECPTGGQRNDVQVPI